MSAGECVLLKVKDEREEVGGFNGCLMQACFEYSQFDFCPTIFIIVQNG